MLGIDGDTRNITYGFSQTARNISLQGYTNSADSTYQNTSSVVLRTLNDVHINHSADIDPAIRRIVDIITPLFGGYYPFGVPNEAYKYLKALQVDSTLTDEDIDFILGQMKSLFNVIAIETEFKSILGQISAILADGSLHGFDNFTDGSNLLSARIHFLHLQFSIQYRSILSETDILKQDKIIYQFTAILIFFIGYSNYIDSVSSKYEKAGNGMIRKTPAEYFLASHPGFRGLLVAIYEYIEFLNKQKDHPTYKRHVFLPVIISDFIYKFGFLL